MTQRVVRPIKIAAFISTIVALAVLFVACQNPVQGPQGPKGDQGDQGPRGIPGKDAQPPLEGKSVGVVILDPTTMNDEETPARIDDPAEPVDLDDAFSGGNPFGNTGRYIYTLEIPDEFPEEITTKLGRAEGEGDDVKPHMLSITLTKDFVFNSPDDISSDPEDLAVVDRDMKITVRAEDVDGVVKRTYIPVRVNVAPTMVIPVDGGFEADDVDAGFLKLTIGTQAAAVEGGEDGEAGDYHNSDFIACPMFNSCTIDVEATDENLDEIYTLANWNSSVSPDGEVEVKIVPDTGTRRDNKVKAKVTITRVKQVRSDDAYDDLFDDDTGDTKVKVWIWVSDNDMKGPELAEDDDPETADVVEKADHPEEADSFPIAVTVDPQPYFVGEPYPFKMTNGRDRIVDDPNFDPEKSAYRYGVVKDHNLEGLELTTTPEQLYVRVLFDSDDAEGVSMIDAVPEDGVYIYVMSDGVTPGQTVKATVTEASEEDDNLPAQYEEFEFTVTVEPQSQEPAPTGS